MRKKVLAAVAALALSPAASAAPGLIDDFNDGALGQYTLTKILDQGAGASNVSFTESGGVLRATSTGATGAEQVLFLRNNALAVGERLVVDVPAISVGDRDIGIALSSTLTPPGLADGAAGDTRANTFYLFIAARAGNDQVVSAGANGGPVLATAQAFPTDITGLFINRTDPTTFDLGYTTAAGETILTTRSGIDASVANTLGFYGDLRVDGTTVGDLDNLAIVIPEPASATATGAAVAALLLRRSSRRRRAV